MRERGSVLVLAVFLVCGGALVLLRSRSGGGSAAPAAADVRGGAAARAAPATTVTVLYSTEKEEWLRGAVAAFERANPDVRVALEALGSLEAVRAVMAGEQRPTLWFPADSLAVNLLSTQWQLAHGADVVARDGGAWPRPALLTPLVFVAWESRARALVDADGALRWPRLRDAVAAPEGWRAAGGDEAWGYVKFGHADPLRSNSGLQALVLMAYGFHGRADSLGVADATAPAFQTFLRGIEAGRQRQDWGATSTGTFMQNLLRQGPSLYDVALVYESVAITSIPRAQGRWEPIRVRYPEVNLWSDHPLALLRGEWVTAAQAAAAARLADHLMSAPAQRAALRYGFRPGNLDVPVVTADPDNPFGRYRDLGVRVDLPRVARAPDGAVIQALLQTWQRTVN